MLVCDAAPGSNGKSRDLGLVDHAIFALHGKTLTTKVIMDEYRRKRPIMDAILLFKDLGAVLIRQYYTGEIEGSLIDPIL